MQKLLDSMTGLRKIRENIPRKETVANVFNERRDFVSIQSAVAARVLTVIHRCLAYALRCTHPSMHSARGSLFLSFCRPPSMPSRR